MATTGIFTKNDFAYAELRNRILAGQLEAGSIIPQARLAKELGVSTTPLREAIRRLTAEGLIQLEPHHDARVTPVTADEARFIYEVRESVDPLAAALAADRRTSADLAAISRALERLTPLRDVENLEPLMAHREFHRSVYCASRNPILIDILERLWDKADRYRLIGLRSRHDSPDDSVRVAAEHRAIYEAVEQQNPQRAAAAMREHIQRSLGRRAIEALEAVGAIGDRSSATGNGNGQGPQPKEGSHTHDVHLTFP
jgi:DNA-binding GntR family transcriptional regulator